MNLYTTLNAAKRLAGESGTDRDTLWLEQIEAASRRIDMACGRHFYTETATRYFDSQNRVDAWIDDYLSITTLTTDSDLDGTYDGETWVENTDWFPQPYNGWPKMGIQMHIDGNYANIKARRYIKATGTFGYGDGISADPWAGLGVTGTVATTDGTALTLSASGAVEAGHTIKIGDEQMYVSAVSDTTATVERGVNGTTAATHSAAAISAAKYPAPVTRACATIATAFIAQDSHAGYKSERIGDYNYTLADDKQIDEFITRALVGFVRHV